MDSDWSVLKRTDWAERSASPFSVVSFYPSLDTFTRKVVQLLANTTNQQREGSTWEPEPEIFVYLEKKEITTTTTQYQNQNLFIGQMQFQLVSQPQ